MGRAMMYIPQFVPVMNSVMARAMKTTRGITWGVTYFVAVWITYSVKCIWLLTSANRNARTMRSKGMIMFLSPSKATSVNSSGVITPCTR